MTEPIPRAPRPRLDLDVRGLLALVSVVCAFTLAIVQVLTHHPDGAEIPPWAVTVVVSVCAFYFGTRSAQGASSAYGRRQTDDVPIVTRDPMPTMVVAGLVATITLGVLLPLVR